MRSMAWVIQGFSIHSNTKPPGIIRFDGGDRKPGLTDPSQFEHTFSLFRSVLQALKRLAGMRSLALSAPASSTLLSLDALREKLQHEKLTVVRRGNRLSIPAGASGLRPNGSSDLLEWGNDSHGPYEAMEPATAPPL